LNTPLVSIVTPSYNQAEFLEQTIQWVLRQDYPRLEYIIVDGGSTDGSVGIIKKYAPKLAWWISEPDRGQAEAINKGLHRARGEIVAWLNSDDFYLPGTVSKAVAAFAAHPQAGLIYGDVLAVDQRGNTVNVFKYGNWGLEGLMTFRVIGQPAVFMRRAVLEQAGYLDTSYHCLLDHQLWIRMARLSESRHVPDLWAAARYHGSAKNITRAEEFGREAYRIIEWMQTRPDLAPLFSGNEKLIWAGAHRLNAGYLLQGGKSAAALCSYGRSFLTHPPTALRQWRRIIFTALSLVGLRSARRVYLRLRRRFFSKPESR